MQGISLEAQMGAGAHPPRAWGRVRIWVFIPKRKGDFQKVLNRGVM